MADRPLHFFKAVQAIHVPSALLLFRGQNLVERVLKKLLQVAHV